MASLTHVTRQNILTAMAECDQLGRAAFLAKHGYRDSAKYVLRHNGKEYPSKAIAGVAAGLAAADFSGGKARLDGLFAKLGFKLGVLAFACASGSVLAAAHEDFAAQQSEHQIDAVYFASGSNRPGQIRGFATVGQALGVVASEITEPAEDALHALAGTGLPVFVDSGAFSEVEFGKHGPRIVKPISHTDWQDVLDLYARLALTLGPQLWVVAPDMVGFQQETLERLDRYRAEIRSLISMRANVLVVSQRGALPQGVFDKVAEKILDSSDYVRALPCNKNATTIPEVAAFARDRRPARLHLLGMGLRSERAPQAALAVAEASPETLLSLDSCLIKESVGHHNGRGSHPAERRGGPRVLTAAKDLAARLIRAGKTAIRDREELGIVLAFGKGVQLGLFA